MTDSSDRSFEPADVPPRLIAWLAAGIVLFLVLTTVALTLFYPAALHAPAVAGRFVDIPEPRLQIEPSQDLAALRRAEDKRLSSYGWVDRERKLIHVPIARALEMTLERGLPEWPRP